MSALELAGEPLRLLRARRVHSLGDVAAAGLGGAAGPPADAVLVRGGRVLAVGAWPRLRDLAPDAPVLDLGDAVVTPALTDAHVHLIDWALARRGPDLAACASEADAVSAVAAHAGADAEAWVVARGWNPHRWGALPSAASLDRALPGRAVALQSHDMHALWASGEALRRAGIDADTRDPEGGRIERDAHGRPTGLLLENAATLVLARVPAPTAAERRAAVLEAQAELHRLGIAGVHSVEPDSLSVYQALLAEDELRLRILQHLPLAKLEEAATLGVRSGFGGPWLRIGGVKMFLDGALGSRTALLRAPYEGEDGRGIATLEPDAFRAAVARAAGVGLASTVHAIGDAAVDLALDVLADPAVRVPALPHRIEHLQLVAPDRLDDAARAGIVASMQPCHLLTDWAAAWRHWGRERSRGAYAFGSLLERGTVLAFGSDIPVEPVDPRLGLYAAVARQDLDGRPEEGWHADERLTPLQALAGYTVGAAWAAGAEGRAGRLVPGALADLVAWDTDPLAAEPRALLAMEAVATIVDGRLVHRAPGVTAPDAWL